MQHSNLSALAQLERDSLDRPLGTDEQWIADLDAQSAWVDRWLGWGQLPAEYWARFDQVNETLAYHDRDVPGIGWNAYRQELGGAYVGGLPARPYPPLQGVAS